MLHQPVINQSVLLIFFLNSLKEVLWPLVGLVALIIVGAIFQILRTLAENKRLASSGIQEIDRMGGRMFERYLAVVFGKKGFKVELTRASKDQGADLVITKDGIRTVVQAKCWKGRVGNKAVQEAVAAKGMYKAQRAMVVTNSFFTAPAKELAKANDVVMWDRLQLIKELLHAEAKTHPHSEVAATALPNTSEGQHRCPRCQRPLVIRRSSKNAEAFWACSGYPKCHYTLSHSFKV